MAVVKSFFKKTVYFVAVFFAAWAVFWGVMLYLFNNTCYTEYALTDDDVRANRDDLSLVAEYAYGLYKNEKSERDDLRRVQISLWKSESEIAYIYDGGSEYAEMPADGEIRRAVDKVEDIFPSPGGAGEFSVCIFVSEGEVEFSGYRYSLYYSPDCGRPDTGDKECRLERVSFLLPRWYHCYAKYSR